MNDIDIRYLKEEDIDGIVEIENLSFKVPWSRKSFEDDIANDMTIYLGAFVGGTPVGYMGLWDILDEGHVTNIAVHPDYRNRGIATALVDRMIEETEKRDIGAITLEVRRSNDIAIGLYKKFGFKEAGIRKRYYSDNNEDAIIMWR